MFSNWPIWKKFIAFVLLLVALFIGFLFVLEIDGRLYERWRNATYLRGIYKSWTLDGSPQHIDPNKYGYSSSGTTYVYTASQTINNHSYQCLFAYRDYSGEDNLAITTNGICLVLLENGNSRLLWISKTRGAAW